jgi:hypothetical protein
MRPAGVRLVAKADLKALVNAIEVELQQTPRPKAVSSEDEGNIRAVFDFYRELCLGSSDH